MPINVLKKSDDIVIYEAPAIWINSSTLFCILEQYPEECTVVTAPGQLVIIDNDTMIDILEYHDEEGITKFIQEIIDLLGTYATGMNVIISTKEL